ncbi:thermonuclease family protein [Dehalococcoides mccartyi]|nr:thermonuclease family protein [Dehalococcoides mccartyi]
MKSIRALINNWRTSRTVAFMTLIVVLMLVSACSEVKVTDDVFVAEDNQSVGSPTTLFSCPDCQLVSVTGVVDGDTIDTSIGRIRFFGVDTPERGDDCFTEATEFTRLLVGSQVRLEDGPRLEDTYGRRLAYIYDSSGNSIDVQLIAGGFAKAWTRDGQHKEVLVGLEQSAKTNNAGCLWATYSSTNSSDYDPTGPDRDCGDFATWKQANDFFIDAGGPNSDPHRLDGDHDGIPCQSLR